MTVVTTASASPYVTVMSSWPMDRSGVFLSAITRSNEDSRRSPSFKPKACRMSRPPTATSAPASGTTPRIVTSGCPGAQRILTAMVGARLRDDWTLLIQMCRFTLVDVEWPSTLVESR